MSKCEFCKKPCGNDWCPSKETLFEAGEVVKLREPNEGIIKFDPTYERIISINGKWVILKRR